VLAGAKARDSRFSDGLRAQYIKPITIILAQSRPVKHAIGIPPRETNWSEARQIGTPLARFRGARLVVEAVNIGLPGTREPVCVGRRASDQVNQCAGSECVRAPKGCCEAELQGRREHPNWDPARSDPWTKSSSS
jgi:hypothetical protein